MARTLARLIGLLGLVGAASLCAADPGPGGPRATPVDPGFSDRSPLSVSLKQVPPDFKTDTAFERLYRLPGEGNLFMRQDGAISAVFPGSVYEWVQISKYEWRQKPEVPPSTLFIIGNPEEHLPGTKSPAQLFGIAPATPGPGAALRPTLEEARALPLAGSVDTSVSTGPLPMVSATPANLTASMVAENKAAVAPAHPSSPSPHDMSSEVYRRERLREIAHRLGPASSRTLQ